MSNVTPMNREATMTLSCADVTTPAAPLRIPRFINNLNEFAVSNGLSVAVRIEPYSNDPEIRLWSQWRGTKAQLLSLGLLQPSQHFPLTRGTFTVPSCERSWGNPLLHGDITVSGEQVEWDINCGPADFTITERGGLEIVTYADETVFHGSDEDLVRSGICDRRRLPTGKRTGRCAFTPSWEDQGPSWCARRQLDGTIAYRLESPAAHARRLREFKEYCARQRGRASISTVRAKATPSHLRLVVDNDRRKSEAQS
jgi:hypothetical protein